MFAWSSIGKSNYNALQANLRKQFSSGVQFDLNYTYSRSIDITSSATRLSWASCCNVGAPGTRLANAFDPNGRRGVSDFDTTHQINELDCRAAVRQGQAFRGQCWRRNR